MTGPSEDPIKALWRAQEEGNPAMTTQAIRALARNHADNLRERLLMGYVLIGIEALVFGSFALKAPNAVARGGYLIILAGLAWMIWRIRLRRPNRLPDDSASTGTLIAFQRAELQRQRNSYASMLLSAGPVIVGLLVTMVGYRQARPSAPAGAFIPFFVLLAAWFILAWVVQRQGARRLQNQIEDLDKMGRL